MALIPLKQIITVTRFGDDLDIFGNPVIEETFDVKCRVDEGSFLTNNEESFVTGKTLVSEAKIIIDKLANIKYSDDIAYTNELNETIVRKPKEIRVKRGISGKPLLTEVFI